MTPVDATKISFCGQPRRRAASRTVWFTVLSPAAPVKALALPELTTMPRTLPPGSALRHQSTGADGQADRVRTPAMVLPFASSARKRSGRPLSFRPTAMPVSRTPAIAGISG